MTIHRRGALAAILAAATPAAAAPPRRPARPPAGGRWAKVEQLANQLIAERTTPGLSVCVTRNGRIEFAKGFGKANLETPAPMSPDSVCKIGSLTKQFTASAILLLAKDGKLRLDDPLARFLPDFPRAQDLTLRRILSHTSGLGNYTNTNPPSAFFQQSRLDRTTAEMVELMKASQAVQAFEPGTDWRYSNTGYVLLGAVIEKATGAPYRSFFQERLFRPAGLTHTAVDDAAEVVPNRAAGYSNNPKAPGGFDNASFIAMSMPGAAGNLRSTTPDLCAWGDALMEGRILPPDLFALMTTPATLNDGQLPSATGPGGVKRSVRYGFGVGLDEVRGHRAISHGGGIQGFGSTLAVFPDMKVAIATLSNTDGGFGPPTGAATRMAFQAALQDAAWAA